MYLFLDVLHQQRRLNVCPLSPSLGRVQMTNTLSLSSSPVKPVLVPAVMSIILCESFASQSRQCPLDRRQVLSFKT